MNHQNFIQCIGNTPLIYIESLSKITGCEIYGKAEFMNPGGSVKDRAALGMILDAQKKGLLKPGGLIVEGTAGNTGIGLALIGNVLGYRTKFVVASSQAQEKIDTLRGMGAEVVVVPPAPFPDPKNYRMVAKKIAEDEGGYYINQFDNPSNFQIHYETTGKEVWNDTQGTVDAFVCAIGSGGTLTGVAQALREKSAKVKIGCIDPVGSSMFNYFTSGKAELSVGESITEGIGQGVVTGNVAPLKNVDHAFRADDQTILNMVHYIVRHEGLFLGSSSGANLCGAYLMAKRLGAGKKVVTILCDSGQKYISKIYNSDFLKQRGLSVTGNADALFGSLDRLF